MAGADELRVDFSPRNRTGDGNRPQHPLPRPGLPGHAPLAHTGRTLAYVHATLAREPTRTEPRLRQWSSWVVGPFWPDALGGRARTQATGIASGIVRWPRRHGRGPRQQCLGEAAHKRPTRRGKIARAPRAQPQGRILRRSGVAQTQSFGTALCPRALHHPSDEGRSRSPGEVNNNTFFVVDAFSFLQPSIRPSERLQRTHGQALHGLIESRSGLEPS